MKKYIYFLLSVAVLTLNGCLERDEFNEIYKDQGNIIINFNTSNGLVVKSEDTSVEHRVDWIDIFIFDENNVLQHKERCDKTGNPDYQQGYFTTNRKRENFEANKKYFVFLIANSIADFSSITISSSTLSDLQRIVERNENLHLSGFGITDADNVNISPERFIMDGVAYTGTTEPEQPMTMVLNDGNLNANTELKATLRRAASKIIVNITQGDNVEFFQKLPETGNAVGFTQYSFYQLPVGTTVIAPLQGMASYLDDRINTSDLNPNGTSFIWGTDAGKPKLTITGYAYANDWSSAEMTKESSLLLNVPMKWDHDNDIETTKEERPNNWFKIPLSRESTFERNKCYVVNININAIGAENKSSAIELDNIEYVTSDWITTTINVGSNVNTANYLMLNTDLVEMYNTNIDLTSLNFSSSSLIKSITLKDVYSQNEDGSFTPISDNFSAYYINKFGIKTNLGASVTSTIHCIPEANSLNGSIFIISPIKPASEQEINTQIAALGKAPEEPKKPQNVPDRPKEPSGKPTEPAIVDQPQEVSMPNIYDYVKQETTTSSKQDYWGNNNYYQTETETNTQYFIDGGEIKKHYKTRTRTRQWERRDWGDWGDWGDWSNWSVWSDWSEATIDNDAQNSYNNALNAYNEYLVNKGKYDEYLRKKEEYEAALKAWKSSPEYLEYLESLEAYNSNTALKEYNQQYELYLQRLEEYNAAKNAIEITATASESHYNTIRYLEFEVENMTGQKAIFRVMQYPTIYINNTQGWFSYRDDFTNNNGEKVTFILHQNGTNATNNITRCSYSNGWTYNTGLNSNSLFCSKYVESVSTSGNNQGKSQINYYYWNNNNPSSSEVWSTNGTDNARMYNVKISSTSSEYTIGKPKIVDINNSPTTDIENGFTATTDDNAKIVSPSFMLASQLGATQAPDNATIAAQHCRQYVETYKVSSNEEGALTAVINGQTIYYKEYRDWRLPTAAEIDIIIKLQNNSLSMDEVLSGASYWSASGLRETGVGTGTKRVRCVRDAI